MPHTHLLEIAEAAFDDLNLLLPEVSPIGAYAMGIATTLFSDVGLRPSIDVLRAASQCESVREAADVVLALRRSEMQRGDLVPLPALRRAHRRKPK